MVRDKEKAWAIRILREMGLTEFILRYVNGIDKIDSARELAVDCRQALGIYRQNEMLIHSDCVSMLAWLGSKCDLHFPTEKRFAPPTTRTSI